MSVIESSKIATDSPEILSRSSESTESLDALESLSVSSSLSDASPKEVSAVQDVRAVFLTHYIPLYQVRVLQELTRSLAQLKILLSTPIEPNREFRPDWSGLDVDVQKTITLRRRWKHRTAGFSDPLYIHIPYDTLSQLRAWSPDVVISHELGARSIAAARYCRRSKAKLVLATFMSEHTEQGRGWLRRRVRERLVQQADAITYNGISCRNYLIKLGADKRKLFHMPYAADDRNLLADLPTRDEVAVRRRLICIGQLSDRKGVMQLIEQANQFCRDEGETLEITFVGDGPRRADLEQLAAGEGTSQSDARESRLKINVLGNQPAQRLPQLMQEHGAVIAPTLADEWLLVVNEGMHAGLPIIGSIYAQAVTTLVRDDQNGWRYDPLRSDRQPTTASLAQALRKYLAADDQTIAAMRVQARQTIAPYTPAQSAAGAVEAIASTQSGLTSSSREQS